MSKEPPEHGVRLTLAVPYPDADLLRIDLREVLHEELIRVASVVESVSHMQLRLTVCVLVVRNTTLAMEDGSKWLSYPIRPAEIWVPEAVGAEGRDCKS